ncbi:E3 ubiquitin-protein ligase trip12 [Plakobranchus ocellatus]|uniref:E3 ubiquitin-protein ligase trip12 n=1 Tax=Plakobranchus ocellatus TaxID=259542 RepID=A0AAV3Z1W9_9GAST|nr:E3 ubiquitin-protein ligase trip12 [Plakobranchus ocellatus]
MYTDDKVHKAESLEQGKSHNYRDFRLVSRIHCLRFDGITAKSNYRCDMVAQWLSNSPTEPVSVYLHDSVPITFVCGGVGGTVVCESALRSAGTLLSQVRAPPSAPRPDGGLKSLRSPCCGLAI